FQTAGADDGFVFNGFPVLAVIDGSDMPTPVPQIPQPLVEAPFSPFGLFEGSDTWVSHLDLDRTVTLEPGHDYWIYVHDAAQTTFFNRRVHEQESPEFRAGIGPYFARPDTSGDWVQAADQVLAFRVVGKPIAPPPPTPVPVPAAFALSATPNPAPGAARVAW